MPAPSWAEAKAFFERDGILRDIYVLETDARDWARLLDALPRSGWSCEFACGDQPAPMPATFAMARTSGMSVRLRVDAAALCLHCYFFAAEDIEFDFWPQDVENEVDYERLVGFMDWVATLLGKPVIVTEESARRDVLFQVEPRH